MPVQLLEIISLNGYCGVHEHPDVLPVSREFTVGRGSKTCRV